MSASREKKLRQDQTASGYVDPKAEKELEEKKAEKRSNVLYSVIAVLFVLVVAASFLWRSNVISRNATALTIDGETYNAAEVNFYYQNVYRGFLQSNSYFISYLGLDTNASLKSQTVNATAASMMGVEEGSSWHDYIMDNTVKQMTMVQRGLKQAQEEGYQFPASVQEQYEDSLNSLKTSAESTGMSVKAYLQRNLGAIMTEKVYNQQVLRMLQYQAYAQSYSDSLTYTDAELEAAYQADSKAYDKAAWEYVVVSGAADSTTDADGNTVKPTDEENAAAKEAAEKLTQSRLKGFAAMNKEMKAALEFLNMPGIRFALKHTRGPLSSHGQDTVEFLISTNPGEEPKPLAKIASGGELSRIMLAFKSALADRDALPTVIYDEIDTGVSGLAAGRIGQLLHQTARGHQVLCITHTPQVAAFADNQLLIQKNVRKDRTFTEIHTLDMDGRVEVLARMISGDKVSELSLASARELIEKSK